MENLQIAVFYAIDKDQTFAFCIKIGPFRKSTMQHKIKTEHAVTLGKKYSKADSSYNHAVIISAFQHLK